MMSCGCAKGAGALGCVWADQVLTVRLQHSGGDPTASAQSARVILADPNTEMFQHLVKTYQNEADKFVESYLWVKKCIEKGQVIYTPVVYKNPGGRRAGEEYASRMHVHVSTLRSYFYAGGRNSANRMKKISAIGSLQKSRTKRQVAERATGYTSNYAKWYAPTSHRLFSRVHISTRLRIQSIRG